MTDGDLNKADKAELEKAAKLRAKVAKDAVEARRAELLADFEAQLAAEYDRKDALFADIVAEAEEAVRKADEEVARRCAEAGIPRNFRPGLASVGWYARGENGSKERRNELRKVATTRLDALAKAAKAQIESAATEYQIRLIAEVLSSERAAELLRELPTAASLMPSISLPEIEQATPHSRYGW